MYIPVFYQTSIVDCSIFFQPFFMTLVACSDLMAKQKHPAGSFTGPRLCWNLSLTTVLCCFFYAEGSLKFFKNSDVSSTLTVFCVLKRVGYTHPFFPTQSFASVCPVKARRSLSWHSQRHCWLLIYIQRDLLGFPPTVLVMEFGTADFSKVQ